MLGGGALARLGPPRQQAAATGDGGRGGKGVACGYQARGVRRVALRGRARGGHRVQPRRAPLSQLRGMPRPRWGGGAPRRVEHADLQAGARAADGSRVRSPPSGSLPCLQSQRQDGGGGVRGRVGACDRPGEPQGHHGVARAPDRRSAARPICPGPEQRILPGDGRAADRVEPAERGARRRSGRGSSVRRCGGLQGVRPRPAGPLRRLQQRRG
mmetsp:Transcript_1923/g.6849  ORF Transcript_1923/g.6849 Transcript_1923/m.6849 type:complete len:213 (+) Transcript_1923:220-858(+)